MSVALKRQQFKAEIRRQNVMKILKHKKQVLQIQSQVNETFQDYVDHKIGSPLPKICVLKFQFLDQENKSLLIRLIKGKEIKLDFSKPQNIALVNKISLTQEQFIQPFLQDVTTFAEKLILSLNGSEKIWTEFHQLKFFKGISPELAQDIMLFPNCMLQFWAKYFATKQQVISMRTYCIVLKTFIYWFGSRSVFFKNFNKYSLCSFINSFLKFQNVISTQQQYIHYKQVDQLLAKFKLFSIPLIRTLLRQKFISDDFIQILSFMAEQGSRIHLLRSLSCIINRKRTFFSDLLEILEEKSESTHQQNNNAFMFSEQKNDQSLKLMSEYSIQSLLSQDLVSKSWQRKVKILEVMNSYLNYHEYQLQLLRGDLKWLLQRLFSIYVYCEERGRITQRIQLNISVFVQNLILLVEDSIFQKNHHENQIENQQEIIDSHEQQENVQIFLQDYDQEQEKHRVQSENLVRQYFIDQLDIIRIVHKSSFSSSQQTNELLSLLNLISNFANNKKFDEKILDTRIIQQICALLTDQTFSQYQSSEILESLFQILSKFHEKDFNFSKYSTQFQLLKNPHIQQFLSQSQQNLLQTIFTQFS